MDRELFIVQTVEWLNRRVAPAGVTVDADTRLFETGIIDSLAVLRLIAWTERAIGRVIHDREIRMDRFGSVRDMAGHFVAGDDAVAPVGCAALAIASASAGVAASRPACARCGQCARRAA